MRAGRRLTCGPTGGVFLEERSEKRFVVGWQGRASVPDHTVLADQEVLRDHEDVVALLHLARSVPQDRIVDLHVARHGPYAVPGLAQVDHDPEDREALVFVLLV